MIECVWNRETSRVEVRPSWNEDGKKRNNLLDLNDRTAGLSNKQGYYTNGEKTQIFQYHEIFLYLLVHGIF